MFMGYEPTISFTPVVRSAVVGASTAAACSIDPRRSLSSLQSYLATGCGVQLDRSQPDRRPALHQSPQVGQTISTIGNLRPFEPSKIGKAEGLWEKGRNSNYSNCNLSSEGLRIGIHHLVFGQAGGTPSKNLFFKVAQSGNNPSCVGSTWSAFLNWADVVQEPRPGFRSKKNTIVGLYRTPPKKGVVVCFDEMGPLQTIPRGGKQWGRRPARRPDRYTRRGTLQWLGAFCPHSGKSIGRGMAKKDAASCKKFWEEDMLSFWNKGTIHLILDNFRAHKRALGELAWKYRRRIRVHWLPTNSSWLNLVESYFATLQRTALSNTDYQTTEEIDHALQRAVEYLNANPRPYVWKKI